jgi:AcrR family transcriptional regulator
VLTLSTSGAIKIFMKTKPKNRYHHGDLRQELLKSAAEIISKEGLDKLTIRTLSHRIEVSRTALYRHFPDKTALLAAIAQDGFIKLTSRYREINSDTSLNASMRFQMIGHAYVEFALTNPGHYRLMFGHEIMREKRPSELVAAAKETFDEFLSSVEEVRKETDVKPDDSLSLASMAWIVVHGLSSLLIDGQVQMLGASSALPALLEDDHDTRTDDIDQYSRFVKKTLNDLWEMLSGTTGLK